MRMLHPRGVQARRRAEASADRAKNAVSPRDLTDREAAFSLRRRGRLFNVSSSPRIVTWVPPRSRLITRRSATSTNSAPRMKPASFEYARPAHLDEACALLAAGDDARIIAGGQTLVPLMAMRLARPTRLIDIARIPELAFIRDEGDAVAIGATTRQCVVEHDPLVRAKLPLLAKVMPFVGHAPTRARGTVGGSIANADPAAEIALVAVTLGATLVWREGGTDAEIAAAGFLHRPDDDGAAARPPASPRCAFRSGASARIGVGFHEVNARQSDFAFVSAAAQVALDADGRCRARRARHRRGDRRAAAARCGGRRR